MTTIVDTTPYPWPYDGAVDPHALALVVCGASGEWASHTRYDRRVEEHIDALRTAVARVGGLVVLIDQTGPLRRSTTVDPSPDLIGSGGEVRVVAAGVDGFYGSPLDAVLHRAGRTHLLMVGRGFETTVHSTLRRANDRGYECLTVTDACASHEPALRPAAISSIEMSGGIFGAVGTTPAVLGHLEALAGESPAPTTHDKESTP